MHRRIAIFFLQTLVVSGFLSANAVAQGQGSKEHWVTTWATAPAQPPKDPDWAPLKGRPLNHETVREIVHVSLSGKRVRIRLSNALGKDPVLVGAAHIAMRDADAGIVASSDQALLFSGKKEILIPPGADVLSDPVNLNVAAFSDLAISLYFPKLTAVSTLHPSAFQTSYVASGDQTAAVALVSPKTISSWVFLTAVSVDAPRDAYAVAAFGDSITDGAESTPNANHRWPDVLAQRLHVQHKEVGVLNEGIGGNRLLRNGPGEDGPAYGPNGLARFDRDVLAQDGVKCVIVLLGINDIGQPGADGNQEEVVSADDVIGGLRQLVQRAHAQDIRVVGATILPFEGTTYPGYYAAAKDEVRATVNAWIRTSGVFDAVVDFDKVTRDPANSARLLPAYDSGDHLHPKDSGLKAMGEAIDLSQMHPE